jgi:predicted ribosome quality control (RQC) complex YloA/Tae2 family protein
MSFYHCLDKIIEEAISPAIGGVEQTRALKDQLQTAVKGVDDQQSKLQSSQKAEEDRKREEQLKNDLERRRAPVEKERQKSMAELQAAQEKIGDATEVNTTAVDEIAKAIEGLNKAQDELAGSVR